MSGVYLSRLDPTTRQPGDEVAAGSVVNGGALTIETPLGGYKQSGYGRAKGVEALHEYARIKAISLSLD